MNQFALKTENPIVQIQKMVEARTTQFTAALPAHIPAERFKRVLLTAIQNNPQLADADKPTLFNSAMRAAQDGLLPDGRDGALVIYKTKMKIDGSEKWIDAVQWMPMVGGIRKKIRNSGVIADLYAEVVYAKDIFDYQLGLDRNLIHKPAFTMTLKERGEIIAAYSVAKFKDGTDSFDVMSSDEIMDVWRKSSKQKDKDGNPTGMWRDHKAEAFKKTVVRRHSKQLPMSSDLDDLLRRDDDLYDMDGASDKSEDQKPKRPQLQDFASLPQTESLDEKPTDAPETPAVTETVDQTTGEITEYSNADAYNDGATAFDAGKTVNDCPGHIKQLGFEDSWKNGLIDRADDLKAAKK